MSSKLSSNFLQNNFAMGGGFKHSVYEFDRFRLDSAKLMLYRDGEAVTLPPKVVKTLAVMVENRDSILSKDELIERVWDDAIVEEANLSQNLYLLRKTLGSRPDGAPYIETLRRRGYKFSADHVTFADKVADVDLLPSAATPMPAAAAPPAQHRYSVERHGNVVALLDWKEPDEPREVIEPASQPVQSHEPTGQKPRSLFRPLAAAAAVLVLAAVFGVGFWLNSPKAAEVVVVEEAAAQLDTVPVTNGEDVNEATISRDGKYFTYHEVDGEFSRMVVQQTRQSKPIEILKGKRIIGAKAFSPDSQFIYFVARDAGADHNSLYRIPTLGGVHTKIVEYATSYPSFSPDGMSIVFHRSNPSWNSSLVIAGADGTRERIILSKGADNYIATNPAWSPDGNQIVFGLMEGLVVGPCVISVLDLKTSEVRPFSTEKWDTCYRVEWRRDGKGIVFVGTKVGEGNTIRRDQVYYISASDGSSRRLTADVHRNQTDSLGITDSNQVLHVPFSRTSQLWVMDPNGNSKTATTISTGSSDGRAGLVPLADGRIAFTARTAENLGAWTINADGSNRQQFISDPLIIEELRATPDGKYFLYATEKEKHSHLYRVDADGGNPKQVTSGDTHETDSALSPDGKWIVFDSMPFSNFEDRRLWRTSIEGGAPTKIADLKCAVPNYSATGKYISCVWDPKIYVLSPDDGAILHTFTTPRLAFLNIGARFTPDEKSVAFIVQQKGTSNIWVQSLDGKPARPLTDFPNGAIYNFAYSPDGSKLYLARGFQIHDAVLLSGF